MLNEERKLAHLSLANAKTFLDKLGGKPTIAQAAINLLISQTNVQLQFTGVQNRADLLFNAKKYTMKKGMIKLVQEKAYFLLQRTNDFKILFEDLFKIGLPFF